MDITWRLRRLSAMSGGEILDRIRKLLLACAEQTGIRTVSVPTAHRVASGRPWVTSFPTGIDASEYRAAADRTLQGRFRVFALREAELGFPPQWNRDPKTGALAPPRFGPRLDYRNEAIVGDIKYLWEPNRHAELVTLAQAWRLTGESKYAQGARTLLESWLDQCPYPLGPHWCSSLELAVRLINWSMAWHLLGGHDAAVFAGEQGGRFRDRWLRCVFQHCWYIANHLSRYSSANNHLIGELTGLFVASVAWPCWHDMERWRRLAQCELEREALRQNGVDGVNKEQANWYHHEVADMLLFAGLVARANGCDFSGEYWNRLRAMLDYLACVMDVAGQIPAFGDADDAVIVRLDPSCSFEPYRSLLATGAVLFASAELKHKARSLDDKTLWLVGDGAAGRFESLPDESASLPLKRSFEEAGYYVLGAALETADEIRIVADAGPLGYLSIAAHGHADALSFTLSAGGRELLVDPGTYSYHTQRKWREYFKGTSAHNTVRVDGENQSVSGGSFLWTLHARTRVVEFAVDSEGQRLIAEHDGYARLRDPVSHRRELTFEASTGTLRVIDRLFCSQRHDIEIFWHFAEDCRVELHGSRIVAEKLGRRVVLECPHTLTLGLYRGSESPPLGWLSRSFDIRRPTTTIRAAGTIVGDARFESVLRVEAMHTARRSGSRNSVGVLEEAGANSGIHAATVIT